MFINTSGLKKVEGPIRVVVLGDSTARDVLALLFKEAYPSADFIIAETARQQPLKRPMFLGADKLDLRVHWLREEIDEYNAFHAERLSEAEGFLLVFSTDSRESFEKISKFHELIMSFKKYKSSNNGTATSTTSAGNRAANRLSISFKRRSVGTSGGKTPASAIGTSSSSSSSSTSYASSSASSGSSSSSSSSSSSGSPLKSRAKTVSVVELNENFTKFPMVLVGNKTSGEQARQVQILEAMRAGDSMGMTYFETTTELYHKKMVEECFLELCRKVIQYKKTEFIQEQRKRDEQKVTKLLSSSPNNSKLSRIISFASSGSKIDLRSSNQVLQDYVARRHPMFENNEATFAEKEDSATSPTTLIERSSIFLLPDNDETNNNNNNNNNNGNISSRSTSSNISSSNNNNNNSNSNNSNRRSIRSRFGLRMSLRIIKDDEIEHVL